MDGFSITPNKHGAGRNLVFKHEGEVSNSPIVPAFMPLQSVGIGTLFKFEKMLANDITCRATGITIYLLNGGSLE